uniref:Uncharacterized protein n=1 Tax=Anopheles atroparvus TaxID=41427 RepID=A0A182ILV0_ANOAO
MESPPALPGSMLVSKFRVTIDSSEGEMSFESIDTVPLLARRRSCPVLVVGGGQNYATRTLSLRGRPFVNFVMYAALLIATLVFGRPVTDKQTDLPKRQSSRVHNLHV